MQVMRFLAVRPPQAPFRGAESPPVAPVQRLGVALWLCWLLLLWLAPSPATADPAPAPSRVLLVSIDGLAWDRLQDYWPRLPNLYRLAQQGTFGPLQTVFPSMTWAAHASLATGMTPGRHGVLGNRYVDRARDDLVESWQRPRTHLRADALWDLAKAGGWSTAALLWPQTSQAQNLDWNVPEVYGQRTFESGSGPGTLKTLEATAGLPQGLIGRFGGEEMFLLDSWSRDAAVALIETKQPRLLLAHFLSADTLGHSFGPRSVAYRWGLELIDRYLGELLAAYQRTGQAQGLVVCIVSDHGFLELTRTLSPAALLKEAPLAAKERALLRWAINGQALYLYGRGRAHGAEPWQPERGKPSGVQRALAKMLKWLPTVPEVERVILPTEYGALGLGDAATDPNLPDLIALLAPDVLARFGAGELRTKGRAGGHGYLPTHAALQGGFILSGHGIAQKGRVDGMRAIDVAPTLAALFGWSWRQAPDGTPRLDALAGRTVPTK